jgi:hypothetical protein
VCDPGWKSDRLKGGSASEIDPPIFDFVRLPALA